MQERNILWSEDEQRGMNSWPNCLSTHIHMVVIAFSRSVTRLPTLTRVSRNVLQPPLLKHELRGRTEGMKTQRVRGPAAGRTEGTNTQLQGGLKESWGQSSPKGLVWWGSGRFSYEMDAGFLAQKSFRLKSKGLKVHRQRPGKNKKTKHTHWVPRVTFSIALRSHYKLFYLFLESAL